MGLQTQSVRVVTTLGRLTVIPGEIGPDARDKHNHVTLRKARDKQQASPVTVM